MRQKETITKSMEEQKIQMWELDGHIKKVNSKSGRDVIWFAIEAETPELCAVEREPDRASRYDGRPSPAL